MNKYLLARMVVTIGIALLVSGWLYLSHPTWFDTRSVFHLPPVPRATATAGATAVPRPVTPTPTPSTPSVGTTQHLDDIWVTPMQLTHSQGDRDIRPNQGDEFLVVLLRIHNRSQIDYSVHAAAFQVLDSHGELVSPLVLDFTRRHLREVHLIPQGRTEGTLVFEVPLRDAATLIYQPDTLDPSKRKEWLLR